MKITKRDGTQEDANLIKLIKRIETHSRGLEVDGQAIARDVIASIVDGIASTEIDEIIALTTFNKTIIHNDYNKLAGRIYASALHKHTPKTFCDFLRVFSRPHDVTGVLVSDDFLEISDTIGPEIDAMINNNRDYHFGYLAYRTLFESYLWRLKAKGSKDKGTVMDRPQYMYMRIALQIHYDKSQLEDKASKRAMLSKIKTSYNDFSLGLLSHATPTQMNSMRKKNQLSSCFLLAMKDDSIAGIYDTLKEAALISSGAGGIGIHLSNIRAYGSSIKGSGGESNGIKPMLQVFNNSARYVDQGGGKRAGAYAMYLEPWHSDIYDFLYMPNKHAAPDTVARDLHYGLWMPNLLMERARKNENWSLFCPNEAPGLSDAFDDSVAGQNKFTELYESYEKRGLARKVVQASQLLLEILNTQVTTGKMYILYKDACNSKSNQKNLGVIKSSNLCTEVIQYSDANETSVCNLASIVLNKFIKRGPVGVSYFDYEGLGETTRRAVYNLNQIIDRSYTPSVESTRSNKKHRPMGVGIQGLADVFFELGLPYTSPEAKEINRNIFETIYFNALKESVGLSAVHGSYDSYEGSPMSQGMLQFDMWGAKVGNERHNWSELREQIKKYGVRNSLLLAPMPTGSTAQILGNYESFEPQYGTIYLREVNRVKYFLVNSYFQEDMIKLGLWNDDIINRISSNCGSIQDIDEIPTNLKEIYKTAFEISMREYIEMARDRGIFIDQSQSMSLYLATPSTKKLLMMLQYGYQLGLKTGMYYLRSKPATGATTLTANAAPKKQYSEAEKLVCSLENPENCIACGS